jgi:hypothetical protein
MDWSTVGSLVGQAAPTIGGLLGGLIPFPGGAVLGTGCRQGSAEALGVPPTPEAVNAAITNGDPATVNAALAAADAKMNAEVEKFKAQLEDVQDARRMSGWNTPRRFQNPMGTFGRIRHRGRRLLPVLLHGYHPAARG